MVTLTRDVVRSPAWSDGISVSGACGRSGDANARSSSGGLHGDLDVVTEEDQEAKQALDGEAGEPASRECRYFGLVDT